MIDYVNKVFNYIMHAWYSAKQSKVRVSQCLYSTNNINKPYIYYLDINDNIIEVSCVTDTKESIKHFKFDDFKYLGMMKKFHCISEEPLKLKK